MTVSSIDISRTDSRVYMFERCVYSCACHSLIQLHHANTAGLTDHNDISTQNNIHAPSDSSCAGALLVPAPRRRQRSAGAACGDSAFYRTNFYKIVWERPSCSRL